MSTAPAATPTTPRKSPLPSPDVRRARWAISLIFLLNGMSFCAIVPRYPELVHAIGLTNTAFGLAVGIGPVGGLLAGLGAAAIMKRLGTGTTAVVFQMVASTCHLLIYTAQSWTWLAGALLLASAADAITDISMNGHGMRVERRYRRSIMNSYHGWWSLGAVAGGLLGAVCAQLDVSLLAQGLVGLVVFGVIALISRRFLLPGHDDSEREERASEGIATTGAAPSAAAEVPAGASRTGRMGAWQMAPRLFGMLAALGMILVFAGSTEDAGATWGALFMHRRSRWGRSSRASPSLRSRVRR